MLHSLSVGGTEIFRFCDSYIDSLNGYSIRQPLYSSTVVFPDASEAAFGGFYASLAGTVASVMFTIGYLGQFYFSRIDSYLLCFAFLCRAVKTREVSFGGFRVQLHSVALSTFHVWFSQGTALEAQSGFLDHSTRRLVFCAVSLTRIIRH